MRLTLKQYENRYKIIGEDYVLDFAIIFLILVSAVIRAYLFDFQSADYTTFLRPWFDTFKSSGFIDGLKNVNSDYMPSYRYLLGILSMMGSDSLQLIKLSSVLFDYVAAFGVYLILKTKFSATKSLFFTAAFLYIPTVVLNAAYWAQCDAMYAAFILFSLYFILKDKFSWAFIMFGLALAFKLQAIFFLPVLLILYFRKRFSILNAIWIVAVPIIVGIPYVLLGRSPLFTLDIIKMQTERYGAYIMNAPSLYAWFFKSEYVKGYASAGVLFAIALLGFFAFLFLKRNKKVNDNTIITLSAFITLLVPFILPGMHERYFYLADILTFIYAIYNPKRFYVPLIVIFASYNGYISFLRNWQILDRTMVVFGLLFALINIGKDLFFNKEQAQAEKEIKKESYIPLITEETITENTAEYRREFLPEFFRETPAYITAEAIETEEKPKRRTRKKVAEGEISENIDKLPTEAEEKPKRKPRKKADEPTQEIVIENIETPPAQTEEKPKRKPRKKTAETEEVQPENK